MAQISAPPVATALSLHALLVGARQGPIAITTLRVIMNFVPVSNEWAKAGASAVAGHALRADCPAKVTTQAHTSIQPADGIAGLRELMELAPTPMWVSHPNGSCGWFNTAWLELTGRALEQEQGDRWPDSLHEEDRARVEEDYRAALAKQEVFEVTYRLRRHDGAFRWIRDRGTPRYDTAGEFVGYIGACIDVTEAEVTRQELEREVAEKAVLKQRLVEAQRLESLGILAGGIAHDFNNMLMGIIGATSLLSEDHADNLDTMEHLSQIDAAAEQAAELCRQLLAYSGQRSIKLSTLSLRSLVEDSVNLWQHSAPKKVSIEFDLAPTTPNVRGDMAQIRQVLLNLVTNAWEAILPNEGTVTVTSGRMQLHEPLSGGAIPDELPPGEYAMLEVSDDGSGMEADTCSRVFEPFFSTKFTGRGLGLAAALGIVRGHDGNIFVKSQPGAGTTFCLLIPALEAAAPSRAASPDPRPEVEARGNALVVDDEKMVRTLVARMLERVGYTVHQAVDGADGIDVSKTLTPGGLDLVVLDVMMPRLDGAEALREIVSRHPQAMAVVMSGYSKTETAQKFEGQHVQAFLEKPFTYHRLRKRLRELLVDQPASLP
ncbi:MAG: response regulator [Deltaproteobacteria bacterium]|nr:response regulator [Deltaproteobacteria bacterium]